MRQVQEIAREHDLPWLSNEQQEAEQGCGDRDSGVGPFASCLGLRNRIPNSLAIFFSRSLRNSPIGFTPSMVGRLAPRIRWSAQNHPNGRQGIL